MGVGRKCHVFEVVFVVLLVFVDLKEQTFVCKANNPFHYLCQAKLLMKSWMALK